MDHFREKPFEAEHDGDVIHWDAPIAPIAIGGKHARFHMSDKEQIIII
jgi:hypothetical protein